MIEGSYELMFGKSELPDFYPMGISMFPVFINNEMIKRTMEKARREKRWVLAFFPGTKPCFYKFWGSINAADEAGLPYLVINAGQHYDDRLTYGTYEFNFRERTACELGIRGDLALKSAELMIKVRWLARLLKKQWPDVTVVPVVLGDTILTSMVPPAWMFSRGEKAIQNEAGLRSMAPRDMVKLVSSGIEECIERQFNGEWELMRNEPMPEQFDTFASAAGSEFLDGVIQHRRADESQVDDVDALVAEMEADANFATRARESVRRVLELKAALGAIPSVTTPSTPNCR